MRDEWYYDREATPLGRAYNDVRDWITNMADRVVAFATEGRDGVGSVNHMIQLRDQDKAEWRERGVFTSPDLESPSQVSEQPNDREEEYELTPEDLGYVENLIQTISQGEWLIPEPGVETRLLLGRSDDGFHYAVYTSYRGGDPGEPGWSKAYPTQEQAEEAGQAA
ncbi:MAG: hypothetical protein JOZ17_24700, partial [Acetobacteraceae bacterium]|nr:hypothetical protein [Acetobacteraceae bacterium]